MALTRDEVKARTIKLIHDYVPQLENAELDDDSVVNKDMGVDSMNFILVICKLEGEFNVKIPQEEWDTYRTLGDLIDAVMKYSKN